MKEANDARKTPAAVPFLRWAGGKRQLLQTLIDHAPPDAARRTYIEPFLGAGSLFFALQPKRATLGDANAFLIDAYRQIRDCPAVVLASLAELVGRHSKEHYYAVRDEYNSLPQSPEQAARFIYLNMTCFNGVFRVNLQGKFNVPKGSKDRLSLPTREQFEAIAKLLKRATINSYDYRLTLARARRGNFAYLDPPYPALNDTAYFAHYTIDRFDAKAQAQLAEAVHTLNSRGVLFLMSNANVPEVKRLYSCYKQVQVPVRRYVSCKRKRTEVSELLIRNY